MWQDKAMKFIAGLFLFFFLPMTSYAQDYDSFVLTYQSVQIFEKNIAVELVFEQPKQQLLFAL